MNEQIIVLARVENTGIKKTGRWIKEGVNYYEETESAPEAKAMVYSRDLADLDRAEEFAADEGYEVFLLPDVEDVLDHAREMVMKMQKGKK